MSKKKSKSQKTKRKMDRNQKKKNIKEYKDEVNSAFFSIITFLISFFMLLTRTFDVSKNGENICGLIIFLILIIPMCLVKNYIKKEAEMSKNNGILDSIISFGTNLGYLSPVLLIFTIISNLLCSKNLNVLLVISIAYLLFIIVLSVIKKGKK